MRFVVVQLKIYCWEGGIEASFPGHAAKAQNVQLPFAEADRPTTKGEGAARLRANPAIATSPFLFSFLSFLPASLISRDVSSLCLPELLKSLPKLQLRRFAPSENYLFYLSSSIARASGQCTGGWS